MAGVLQDDDDQVQANIEQAREVSRRITEMIDGMGREGCSATALVNGAIHATSFLMLFMATGGLTTPMLPEALRMSADRIVDVMKSEADARGMMLNTSPLPPAPETMQ